MSRVVFHSPMVVADVNRPSGLARVAALYVRALERAGYTVDLPNLPLARDLQGNAATQSLNRQQADQAAAMLIERIRSGARPRPDLWFSYHVYYKSPDWIGPRVCDALGIQYVIAEGSHAPKRASGPWRESHIAVTHALGRANCLLASTAFDRHCLEQLAPGRVFDMKPFIDVSLFTDPARPSGRGPRALTMAMMRSERKLASYRLLADALGLIDGGRLSLTIAGDGIYRQDVEDAFSAVRSFHDIHFTGAVAPAAVAGLAGQADFFAWPGIGEAYGIAYLEAQACGLPVVACRDRGVPDVVQEGRTALLSPTGDPVALAHNIKRLMREPELRSALGLAARSFVLGERSLEAAAARLRQILGALAC